MPTVSYVAGAELPPLLLKFQDETGAVIDLTSFTCQVKIAAKPGDTVLLTRSATGGPTGMTVYWQAGDLNLPGGIQYVCEAQARNASNLDYKRTFTLQIEPSL